jgi:transposase
MAGITVTPMNGELRILVTFPFRNSKNKPDCRRRSLGYIDSKTHKPVFNKKFFNLIAKQGLTIDYINNINLRELTEAINFGTYTKEQLLANDLSEFDVLCCPQINYNAVNKFKEINLLDNNHDNSKKIEFSDNGNINYTINESEYTVTNFGPHLLLEKIMSDTGLLSILKQIFPQNWSEIITLSYYLVSDNKPVMYCQQWVEKTETYLSNSSLSSQRISELLDSLSYNKIMDFYNSWFNFRSENEYLALDITSISSYSNLINSVEAGYNRDGDNLEQINLCLLFGENSGLPVFSSHYPGSTNDVIALKSFIEQIKFFGNNYYNLVMDKGFYSAKNINMLLEKYKNYKYLIAVPFSTLIARNIVSEGKTKFDEKFCFDFGQDIFSGYSFLFKYNNYHDIKYHVFYNNKLFNEKLEQEKSKALTLKKEAIINPEECKKLKTYTDYLVFNKDKNSTNYTILVNIEKIYNRIKNNGWLIVTSNDMDIDYKEILAIYRNKNVIEEAFRRMKNNLDLRSLRVHDENRIQGKLFVTMIALIINSHIHNVMLKNNLYDKYTLSEILFEIEKIKLFRHDKDRSISPITKSNRIILEAFGLKVSLLN